MIPTDQTTATHRAYLQNGDHFRCSLGTFKFVKLDHVGRVHAELLSSRTNTPNFWVNFGDDNKMFNVLNKTVLT